MPANHKKLDVWQKSIQLIKDTYSLIRKLPDCEKFALANQMQRAVISVAANISEGHGRDSDKEFIKFLRYSKGSLYELETELTACNVLGYLSVEQTADVFNLIEEISRMLNSLIKKIETRL